MAGILWAVEGTQAPWSEGRHHGGEAVDTEGEQAPSAASGMLLLRTSSARFTSFGLLVLNGTRVVRGAEPKEVACPAAEHLSVQGGDARSKAPRGLRLVGRWQSIMAKLGCT